MSSIQKEHELVQFSPDGAIDQNYTQVQCNKGVAYHDLMQV